MSSRASLPLKKRGGPTMTASSRAAPPPRAGQIRANRATPNSGKENPMSVTLIAKIKAKQGSEQALEDAFRDMIKKVRAAEPGCQAYILHKSPKDATQFVWYETYSDQAAFDTHRKTEHMKEMGARIANLLDGAPQLEFLTELDRK
jgi:quinol monooxygenase YgiN